MYSKAISELIKFYKFKWVYSQPVVYILDSREDINNAYGKETQDWLIGWSAGRSLFLLNRKNVEKESKHKYSDDLYFTLIKHELSHQFFKVITNSGKPNWLNEGIATYVSEQRAHTKKIKKFEKFLGDPKKLGEDIYPESGYAIEILCNEFGEDKLHEFVKGIKGYRTVEDLKKIFKDVFGMPLKYESFNKLLKDK